MIQPTVLSLPDRDLLLAHTRAPLPLDELIPPRAESDPSGSPWEVEIGFGKGRYLLRRAKEDPDHRFLGIEIAGEYQREFVNKARRRGLTNWMALRGDALFFLSAVLPKGFASAVHVYFPDPWPKSKQQKRRLFDPETVDLVLGLLAPGAKLSFATDFVEYGALVAEILATVPGLEVTKFDAWPEGPRTNYESKYVLEGRQILRLEASFTAGVDSDVVARLHPEGKRGVLAALRTAEIAPAVATNTTEEQHA